MKKIKGNRTFALLLCCLAVLALAVFSGILDKQQIWANTPVEYLTGKNELSLASGDKYGVITGGPYTELPAGRYRLKWQIEGDGVNIVRIRNSNDVEITPAEFETAPGAFEGEAYFDLHNTVHNFSISVEFCDGTWIRVHNFRLYTPAYRDHVFTLAAVMAAAVLLCWLHETGRMTRSRREILVVLAAAVIFASVPALREDCVYTFDVPFHAARLHNLADSLASGQFPGRTGGYTYNGYGAVTSVFYPDLLLYPLALMLKMGASMTYVLNVLTIAMNALTALCMYAAGKRMFSDRYAGAFAAVLYVCVGFRLDRLYGSYMVGQILAMAFVPLFLLGLWEVFFGDKSRWLTLVAGATLVFQSHMLTTLLCAGIAAAALVCFALKLWREKRLGVLMLAAAATLALNMTTLVPILTTYLSGVTTSVGTYGFVDLTHEMVQMLGTDKELGLALVLGVAALICCSDMMEKGTRRDILLLAAVGVVCVWMCTDMFPWRYVFALTGGVLEILQFSWRFLAIAAPCLCLCGGLGYALLLKDQGAKGLLAVLAVAVLCTTPVIEHALDMPVIEFGQDGSPYILTPEYQFEGTDLEATKDRSVLTQGDIQLSQYEKNGTRISVHVDAQDDAKVTFPLFGFEGYEAELDGRLISWTRGENNRITVALEKGTQGMLSIRFAGNPIWIAADGVSLLCLLALVGYGMKKRRAMRFDGGKCR